MSLHSRVTLLENGGDWMLGELTLWTAFLPLGKRFSVDAVRASLRARRETTAAELGGPQGDGCDGQPGHRLAGRARADPRDRERLHLQRGSQGRTDVAVGDGGALRDSPGPHVHPAGRPDASVHDAVVVAHHVVGRAGHGGDPAHHAAGACPEGVRAAGRDRLHHRAARRLPAVHQPGAVLVRDDRLHAVLADGRGLGRARAPGAAAQAPADGVLRRRLRRLLPVRPRVGAPGSARTRDVPVQHRSAAARIRRRPARCVARVARAHDRGRRRGERQDIHAR